MTLVIRNNKIVVPPNSLPPLTDRFVALRLPSLVGLYVFEDVSVGSVYAKATDISGLGNHAILRTAAGYSQPLGTTQGAAFTMAPLAAALWDTPIARTDGTTGYTQITAFQQTMANSGNTPGAWTFIAMGNKNCLGQTSYNVPPSGLSFGPDLGTGNADRLFVNDFSTDTIGTTNTLCKTYTANNQAHIQALRLDPTNKLWFVDDESGQIVHNGALKSGYVPVAPPGNFSFGMGIWNVGAAPVSGGSTQFAAAIFNTPLTDAQTTAAIKNLETVLVARGIAV
jgi:hypothetical protein